MIDRRSETGPEPIAIVGCGPAGAACAVQLARSGLNPVVYDPGEPGGTVRHAHLVENYPGFPRGISGVRLAGLIVRGIEHWGIDVIPERVVSLTGRGEDFELRTPERVETYRAVVVATGTRPRRLTGIRVEKQARSRIHYEVLRLAEEDIGRIGILGAGDVAVDYGIGFSAGSEVHVFHRSRIPTCLPLLLRRAEENGIHFHGSHSLVAVRSSDDGLLLEFTGGSHTVDALIPAIGREPVLDFLDPQLRIQRESPNRTGLFLAGDVVNGRYRQVAIAAGDGLRAAMEVTGICG